MPQLLQEDAQKEAVVPRQLSAVVLSVVFIVCALWLLSPMLTSSYVEAYVARLQSMAILNSRGYLGLDDQAYPVNTELLYVTRLGMVWLLGGAMRLLHSTSLVVLRLLTIASFGTLAASSVVFARRWARVSTGMVLAALVLTPGLVEPSFFFADNLVAAALTSVALAMVGRRLNVWLWAVDWRADGVRGADSAGFGAGGSLPCWRCFGYPRFATCAWRWRCCWVGAAAQRYLL